MAYKYETHMHTSEGSACASSTGAEMALAHKQAGYEGIFVTDHFFNGNTAVPKDLPWEERVARFCLGYEHAKETGDQIGLQVYFGFEYAYHGAEFLVYNLDKQWLIAHENLDQLPPREALELMHQGGAFIIQAHPFRERDYIDHIQLFPRDIDGVEAINAAHLGEEGGRMNARAFAYAKMFDLPVTAGSDSHSTKKLFSGGVAFPQRLEQPLDYLAYIRSGNVTLLGDNTVPDKVLQRG